MNIIHINDKLTVSGGVEVYISQVQGCLNNRGIESDWVAIERIGKDLRIKTENVDLVWEGPLSRFNESPLARHPARGQIVFHVHSFSEPAILKALIKIAPVVRKMADPRVFCPGQGKYWAKTETICSVPMGLHCFRHAYTQNCCNRRPDRMLQQYRNSRFEIKYAAPRYFKLLANSTYTKREALKVGISSDRIEILHNFTPKTKPPTWQETSQLRLLYIGRLSRTKGVQYMLPAFQRVLSKFSDVVLDLIGAGHDEALFKNQAKKMGVDASVNFLGWGGRVEIDQAIGASDIVLFPSVYPEAFGIVGIEAMMRGKPVVGFDVGGVKDWLRHGETGLLVPVKDTQGFADAVIRVLDDDVLRRRMGTRAREVALAEFSEEVHMKKLIQIYEQALDAS
ncbi:glycosyltransferase family 4 protein [Akkermansiaceae bacterium]|nr:glycosyltransferase family 4 protein [Akkermansiaceae bacterium]